MVRSHPFAPIFMTVALCAACTAAGGLTPGGVGDASATRRVPITTRTPSATYLAGPWRPHGSESSPGPFEVAECDYTENGTVTITQTGTRITYHAEFAYKGGPKPPPGMITSSSTDAAGDLKEGEVTLTGTKKSYDGTETTKDVTIRLKFDAATGHLVGESEGSPVRHVPITITPKGATPCPRKTPAP